jgi:hypothetical protein
MFYSTRYFFRLVGLLLAVYLVYTHFPNVLWGLRRVWEYIEYLFSGYTFDGIISGVYKALSSLLRGIKNW